MRRVITRRYTFTPEDVRDALVHYAKNHLSLVVPTNMDDAECQEHDGSVSMSWEEASDF